MERNTASISDFFFFLQHGSLSLFTLIHPFQVVHVTDSCPILSLSRLSHLVNPKGETCRCTTAPLNPAPPLPLPPALSQPPSSIPVPSVVGAVQTPPRPAPPSPSKHKGSIYQYVLVTFRGQCCCSWTLPAGSQKYSSVSAGHYVCLLWVYGCREECQVLGQTSMSVRSFSHLLMLRCWSLKWATFWQQRCLYFHLKVLKSMQVFLFSLTVLNCHMSRYDVPYSFHRFY